MSGRVLLAEVEADAVVEIEVELDLAEVKVKTDEDDEVLVEDAAEETLDDDKELDEDKGDEDGNLVEETDADNLEEYEEVEDWAIVEDFLVVPHDAKIAEDIEVLVVFPDDDEDEILLELVEALVDKLIVDDELVVSGSIPSSADRTLFYRAPGDKQKIGCTEPETPHQNA
jgi:hypothetical protein